MISFGEGQVFHNAFNENSKGFFNNAEKIIFESFEQERQSYKDIINHLKEEVTFLRDALNNK